jgi:hypothetical protein
MRVRITGDKGSVACATYAYALDRSGSKRVTLGDGEGLGPTRLLGPVLSRKIEKAKERE